MWRISKTLVCLLTAAIPITHGRTDDTPIPDLGDHTPDGFVVRCYWVGVFDMTSRFGTRSQRGTFGLLLADLNGEQKTHATFILTQEVDDHGKLRITSRDAHWSSTVSHLHYWSADGDRPGAGPGGTGGGDISPDDMSVNATEANGRVKLNVSFVLRPGGYSFDVRYHPLEMPKVTRVWVAGKEETKRWDAAIFGFSGDEPINPNSRKVAMRYEWGNPSPKSSFYGKWVVTRVCQAADVHLVEPHGNKTQYTFTGANSGVLNVVFKAAATPGSAGILEKMKDRVSFKMEGIGNSKIEWDPVNPDGRAIVEGGFLTAKLKFIGLPEKNSDFGKKKVELLVDGSPVEGVNIEVFFPKNATNHPRGTAGDPNWFYYWKEGNVCGIRANDLYEDAEQFGATNPAQDKNIRLGRNAPEANDGPDDLAATDSAYGSVAVTGHGKGIKCVAETIEHELHHIAIYEAYHKQIAANRQLDADRDNIPTAAEATLDAIKSDPANGDTFNLVGIYGRTYATYGDEDVRCRKKELRLSIPYHVEKDWANPGCQTRPTPFGP